MSEPRWICVYCGKDHASRSGLGSDVQCCGEVGHVEPMDADESDVEPPDQSTVAVAS